MWILLLGAAIASPGSGAFEANVGQAPAAVSHLVRGDREVAFVTEDGFVLSVPTPDSVVSLRGRWRGASRSRAKGAEPLQGALHYFLDGPEGRRAARYRRLEAANMYPGIDLGYGLGDTLRFGFELTPGADAARIRLGFDGEVVLRIEPRNAWIDVVDPRSNRVVMTVQLSGLRAWQEGAGRRDEVDVRFVRRGDALGFTLGPHDARRAVYIDPDITFASYIGGANFDEGRDVAVDAAGFVYVTGASLDPGAMFPTTSGAVQPMPSGAIDAFVLKVDPSQTGANALVYGSFIGGASDDQSNGIAVDANGRAAIGGTTWYGTGNAFPTTANAYSQTPGSSFVTMLNAAGSQLVYSTFFGGTTTSVAAVAIDPAGDVIAVGVTDGTTAIPQVNAMTVPGQRSAFVVKFDVAGVQASSVVYGTRFDANSALGVEADATGIYLLGQTAGLGLNPTPGAAQTTAGGGFDYFVAKLDPAQAGSAAIVYTTYVGGTTTDGGAIYYDGIAIDPSGAVYVTGVTGGGFPTTPGALATTAPGGGEGFVTKIAPSGGSFVYSTYLGATGNDGGYDIAVDAMGRAYVAGFGDGVPVTGCGATSPGGGFVLQLDAQGSAVVQASYLAPGANLRPYALALGPTGNAYVVGSIGPPLVLSTPGGFQTVQAGLDAFVAELSPSGACADLAVSITASPNPVSGGAAAQLQASLQNLGSDDVAQADLSVFVPPELTVLGITPSVCTGGPTYVCPVGPLAAGGSVTVAFDVEATAAGTFTATAAVSAAVQDPDSANDADEVALVVTAPNTPCGFVTLFGACADDTLSFCEDRGRPAERLVEVDCATDAFPAGVPGQCTLINASYGFDCAVSPGGVCAFVDAQDRPIFALCAGDAAGCRIDPSAGTAQCELGLPACLSEGFDVQCAGDLLVQECQVDQPVVLDCASIGGECANARCEALPLGAPCEAGRLLCATGLVCDAVSERCGDPAQRCDPTTYRSRCDGTTLTACDRTRSRVVSVDCNAAFTPSDGTTCGAPFTCQGRSCGDVNLTCIGGGEGARCDLAREIYCGAGFGCVLERDVSGDIGGVCRSTSMCAAPPDPACVGDIAPVCLRGEGITAVEAQGVDCASFGGACGMDGTTAICVGGVDAVCQVVARGGALLRCQSGLTCEDVDPDGFGVCRGEVEEVDGGVRTDASTPGRDGGVADAPDAGVEPPEDGEGCSCRAAPRSSDAESGWLLLALLLGRPRKKRPRH
ncbi:MAG: hypothetical protein RMA76_29660 [Deltaproteobacteria bacterium]|jgi:hypothetical protein